MNTTNLNQIEQMIEFYHLRLISELAMNSPISKQKLTKLLQDYSVSDEFFVAYEEYTDPLGNSGKYVTETMSGNRITFSDLMDIYTYTIMHQICSSCLYKDCCITCDCGFYNQFKHYEKWDKEIWNFD